MKHPRIPELHSKILPWQRPRAGDVIFEPVALRRHRLRHPRAPKRPSRSQTSTPTWKFHPGRAYQLEIIYLKITLFWNYFLPPISFLTASKTFPVTNLVVRQSLIPRIFTPWTTPDIYIILFLFS